MLTYKISTSSTTYVCEKKRLTIHVVVIDHKMCKIRIIYIQFYQYKCICMNLN